MTALILGHSVPVSPIIPKDIKPRPNADERNRKHFEIKK